MNSFHHFGEKILKLEETLRVIQQPCPHYLPLPTTFQDHFSLLLRRPQSSHATVVNAALACVHFYFWESHSSSPHLFLKTQISFSLQWNLLNDANHIDVLLLLTPID